MKHSPVIRPGAQHHHELRTPGSGLRALPRGGGSAGGSVVALHYATGRTVRVVWDRGRITSITPARRGSSPELWVAPALVDLQVNGFAGIDFQRDDLTADDLDAAVAGLRAAGCVRFLLTLITDDWAHLTNRLRRLCRLRARSPALRHAIAGWHLEGPFLSSVPGYHGAHDPRKMVRPTAGRIRALRRLAAGDSLLLTLAPEVPGALEAIRLAVALGFRVSLGHTNASAVQLAAAVAAGASGFTHLGNACPQQLDRHDNILWRALDLARGALRVGLIPDGIHVGPALFRLVHRLLPPEAVWYATDAMAAAGAAPGRYSLGHDWFEVGPDRVVRRPGQNQFAGSALVAIEGVRRASAMLGRSWRSVWDRFSVQPAGWMDLGAGLAAGCAADLCLLREGAGGALHLVGVVAQGEEVASGATNGVHGE